MLALDELRKKAEADMEKELEAIRAARAEAEAAIAAARQTASPEKVQEVSICGVSAPYETHARQTTTASESLATLKRKRDELELEDDDNATVAPRSTSCQALFDKLSAEPPRKRKRSERMVVAKRIVAGVAKTTAIAAIGAVATWSALAFS